MTILPENFGWTGVGYVMSQILRHRSARLKVQRNRLLTRWGRRAIFIPVT